MKTHDKSQPKRVLILMAEAGFGHRSAARAVASALQEMYCEAISVSVVNPLEDERTPALLRDTQTDYDAAVRKMPGLYRLGYEISDTPLPAAVIDRAFTVMLYEALHSIVERYQPDVIVTTYQSYLAPLSAVFAIGGWHIPLVTVVTDLVTVHRLWFNDVADLCLVPTQVVYDLAIKDGLAPDVVRLTGIPVDPRFGSEARDRPTLRSELGWQQDRMTVLAVGSKRVAHLPEALNVLNHSGLPLQLVVVAGGDDVLYQKLQGTDWHLPAHVYNYVDNMPTLMHASDCVACKAGGLTVTEALACGLPLLLVDVIEGQETGNAQFVVEGGAGELARDPVAVLETMYHWLAEDGQLLEARSRNASSLGRPRAAYDVAALAWEQAQRGPRRPDHRIPGLSDLTDLLDRFNVAWRHVETGEARHSFGTGDASSLP